MNRYILAKAGIDANQGIQRLGGDKALYEKLLRDFLNESYFNTLTVSMCNGDLKTAFDAAHSLKGVAGNLSFIRFSNALLPLVESLRIGDFSLAALQLPAVQTAYNEITSALLTLHQ